MELPYFTINPTIDPVDRDRLHQWTQAETKEFLAIRAELDWSFTETKRNKPLWDTISTRMSLKGFSRTPDQCKSKWKNLITRFKASESSIEGEVASNRGNFPFHDEMRSIFSDRMARLLRFDKGKEKVELEEEEEEEEEEECKMKKKKKKKRKRGGEGEVESALREFGRQQMEMEARWVKAAEEREMERRLKEEEWRREMERLEGERMAMERRWREREEERRAGEEARAERRHALVTALLTKLAQS